MSSINNLMAANLASLQQTVSMSMLKSAQSTQAAQATVMLQDFQTAQAQVKQAAHPTAGNSIDIRA